MKILVTVISALFLLGLAGTASADHVTCSPDLNEDGKVDAVDSEILEGAMGNQMGDGGYDERADLNQDDRVDAEDRDAYGHCR